MSRNVYIVAYDVTDKKRLRHVHRCMRGYGSGVQYSVFRCELSAKERELMMEAVRRLIHEKDDRVLVIDLGPAKGWSKRRVRTLGRAAPMVEDGPVVF